jgi:hypothetical protein
MKNPRINGLMTDAVRRVLRGGARAGNAADAARRPGRQGAPSCESLEGRVVLSNWGGADLVGGLAQIGVVTTSVLGDAGGRPGGMTAPGAPGGGQASGADADSDLQALQTKVQELAAKSNVTVADMSALASDSKAIETAGGGIKADDLNAVLSSLATAVAGGADTSQAQSDFNALFADSKVDQDAIDKTFADLVQTIQDSNITTTDLTDFATAVSALPKPGDAMQDPGFGGGPGGFNFNGAGPQGDALTASLAKAGVTAAPADQQGSDAGATAPGGGSKSDQLQTDLDKLRTDQQTVSAKSEVTSDDLDQLKTDSKDITTAGLQLDPKSLQTVVNDLVTAVAGGADTSQVQSDFNALFADSKVDQTVIDQTFNDLVQTIQDSKITSDDASLIADDQAAVQADLDALPQGGPGGGFMGPGGQGGFAGFSQGGPGGFANGGPGVSFAQGGQGGGFANGGANVSFAQGGPGGMSMNGGANAGFAQGGPFVNGGANVGFSQGGPGGVSMSGGGNAGFAQVGPGAAFANGGGNAGFVQSGPGGMSMNGAANISSSQGGPGAAFANGGGNVSFNQVGSGGVSMNGGGQGMGQVGPVMVQNNRSMASPVGLGGFQGGGMNVGSGPFARGDSSAPTGQASGDATATPADAARPTDSTDSGDPGSPTDVASNAPGASNNAMGVQGRAGARGRIVRSVAGRFGRGGATGGTQGFASGAGHQGRSMNGFRRG